MRFSNPSAALGAVGKIAGRVTDEPNGRLATSTVGGSAGYRRPLFGGIRPA
jgi:hypothetical protein